MVEFPKGDCSGECLDTANVVAPVPRLVVDACWKGLAFGMGEIIPIDVLSLVGDGELVVGAEGVGVFAGGSSGFVGLLLLVFIEYSGRRLADIELNTC